MVPTFDPPSPKKRAGERAAAEAVLPLVLEVVPGVRSMVEVGCGGGEWLAVARTLGVEDVVGIDGPWRDVGDDPAVEVDRVDVAEPFTFDRSFDLALCTEFAEHLPPERAAGFVADLTRLAPVVAFSAAIPGQGGIGHVNEQWPDHWASHFAAAGYRLVDPLRRRLWSAGRGPAYIAQNLLLAVDEHRLSDYPALSTAEPPLCLVHPDVYREAIRRVGAVTARRAAGILVSAVRRRVGGRA